MERAKCSFSTKKRANKPRAKRQRGENTIIRQNLPKGILWRTGEAQANKSLRQTSQKLAIEPRGDKASGRISQDRSETAKKEKKTKSIINILTSPQLSRVQISSQTYTKRWIYVPFPHF